MDAQSSITTFLFTDIEGSSRLWEQDPERMRPALAKHDALLRSAVEGHGGSVVKMTGDGVCAAFADPHDAVGAVLAFQQGLADPAATSGLALRARSGLHLGVVEYRDGDYYGNPINRASRIMSAAHGGQVLISQAVVEIVRDRLPDGVTLRDLGFVRLRDLASPEHIYQLLHPALVQDFPALRSLAATPNNLPQQVTSFVGRQRELAEIIEQLRDAPLLTLCGAGGIGKTRLSLQVAADVLDDYPDGVWLVELAPLTDARLVPQAVASVIGVKEEAGHPVTEALVRHLADLRTLLILDNCEHLVGACAELADQLLRSGRKLRILASSRERLHVAGETVYAVPALGVPDAHATIDAEALGQFGAVRLFAERAAAATASFRLTPQNSAAVISICRQLDGIPLAIELAAARTRALSVEAIAARLGDRFRLLTTGNRTALPRQQTLRALVDWSHELLGEKERTLFRRLAVFAGGFTLEAAEAVCAGGDVEKPEVLDLLAALVEKSLAIVDAGGGRYGLLETMREYSQSRLHDSGELPGVQSRHLDYFLALAESAGPQLAGSDQAAWLARLDADRENLMSSLAFCARTPGGADSGYRMVHAIKLYWFKRGLLNLGHRMTELVLSVPAPEARSLARCRALWVAGQISSYTGRYEEAQSHLRESLAIARHLDDRRMVAAVLNVLALAALGKGDRLAAKQHCEEALDLARESGNKREIAVASNALAQLHRLDGNIEAAEPLYEQVVALAHELRDREFAAIGIIGRAMVAIGHGTIRRARGLLGEALAIAVATGSTPAQQSAVEVAAGLAALQHEWEFCARLYGAAEAQTLRTGIRRDPADEAFLKPLLARARQGVDAAGFAQAEAAGREAPFETVVADVERWLSGT